MFRSRPIQLSFCTALLSAAMLPAAQAATAESAVSVEYVNPDKFRDLGDRYGGSAQRYNYMKDLNAFLSRRAARAMEPGQTLRVAITDVDMAGEIEWWRRSAGEVRVVRDLYPPRIDLRFTLLGADGAVLKEGTRQLRDTAFMMSAGPMQSDPLKYEKALLDSWVDRELRPAKR